MVICMYLSFGRDKNLSSYTLFYKLKALDLLRDGLDKKMMNSKFLIHYEMNSVKNNEVEALDLLRGGLGKK